jgi:predicted anti-sigma-YlaC factor YlaD
MNDHDTVRPLLALSAAGLLDPDGERRVREHTAACEACRAELEGFAQLTEALGAMPAAPPPPDLLARTHTLIAAEADRREGTRLAAAAAISAAVLVLYLAAVLPLYAWFAWTLIPSVMGGAAAIILASYRRRLERSLQ